MKDEIFHWCMGENEDTFLLCFEDFEEIMASYSVGTSSPPSISRSLRLQRPRCSSCRPQLRHALQGQFILLEHEALVRQKDKRALETARRFRDQQSRKAEAERKKADSQEDVEWEQQALAEVDRLVEEHRIRKLVQEALTPQQSLTVLAGPSEETGEQVAPLEARTQEICISSEELALIVATRQAKDSGGFINRPALYQGGFWASAPQDHS